VSWTYKDLSSTDTITIFIVTGKSKTAIGSSILASTGSATLTYPAGFAIVVGNVYSISITVSFSANGASGLSATSALLTNVQAVGFVKTTTTKTTAGKTTQGKTTNGKTTTRRTTIAPTTTMTNTTKKPTTTARKTTTKNKK
jgi:hypothetical protein